MFRMTPNGDAVRIWGAVVLATLLAFALTFYTLDQVVWSLSYISGFVFFLLVLTVAAMYRCSPEEFREWAVYQSKPRSRWRRMVLMSYGKRIFGGRTGFSTIVFVGSIGLICAVLLVPVARSGGSVPNTLVIYALSIAGVLSSWAFLHVAFALQYATLYYRPGVSTGFDFPGGDGKPGIVDFAYFAFTVGTSFAASDVSVTSARIRKVVLAHSILAFFYNTAILALVINIVIAAL